MRSTAYSWLKGYLEIKQCVQINDTVSEFRKVTCGVPQGLMIGPKLSIFYINDISNVTDLLKSFEFMQMIQI